MGFLAPARRLPYVPCHSCGLPDIYTFAASCVSPRVRAAVGLDEPLGTPLTWKRANGSVRG